MNQGNDMVKDDEIESLSSSGFSDRTLQNEEEEQRQRGGTPQQILGISTDTSANARHSGYQFELPELLEHVSEHPLDSPEWSQDVVKFLCDLDLSGRDAATMGITEEIRADLIENLSKFQTAYETSNSVYFCEVFFFFLPQKNAKSDRIHFSCTPNQTHTIIRLLEMAAVKCGIELANFNFRLIGNFHLTYKKMLMPLPKLTDQIHSEMLYMFTMTPNETSNLTRAEFCAFRNAMDERLTKLEVENADLRERNQILTTINNSIEELMYDVLQGNTMMQGRLAHSLEHLNAKIKLVTNDNRWDTKTSPELMVQANTVTNNSNGIKSICAMIGYEASLRQSGDKLQYIVNYAEYTINKLPSGKDVFIGFAYDPMELTPLDYGLCQNGVFYEHGERKRCPPITFVEGDTVGCGQLLIQESDTARAANCVPCSLPKRRIFYTVNGKLKGIPYVMSSYSKCKSSASNTYALLRLDTNTKVTANFGPNFLYKIPPAKNLLLEGLYCTGAD